VKHLEQDDPFELVGTGFPVGDPEATDRETARCMIEEYALTGFTAVEIYRLFETPLYAYPHAIYKRRGAQFVSDLVTEVFGGSR
jgi:hypothetical protein